MHWCVSSSARVSMCSVHDVPNNLAIRGGFALLGESTSVSKKMFRFLPDNMATACLAKPFRESVRDS